MNIFFLQFFSIFLSLKLTLQHLDIDQTDQQHECSHVHINIEQQISHDYFEHHINNNQNQQYREKEAHNYRALIVQTLEPIRITTDLSGLDDNQNEYTLSNQQKNYLYSLMESSKTYLNKLIKVNPRTSPIIRRGNKINNYECIDVIPSKQLVNEGVDNSDLHILVTFEYTPNASHVANAGFCELEPSPIIGRIKFNIAKMVLNKENFQQNLWITLHELTHVLGFSGNAIPYWIDPETKKPYIKSNISSISKILSKQTVRGVEGVYVLKSKNVLEVSREHFGCQTLEGLPLENQGGLDSFGSHWEKDLLQNEYMTANRVGRDEQALFSQFSAALLLDTGFYAEINQEMVQKIDYGKFKGCKFVEDPCEDSIKELNEFRIEEMCELNSYGLSLSFKNNFSECQSIVSQSFSMCQTNSRYIQQSQVLRNQLGKNSKCFRSTSVEYFMINQSEANIRCHQYSCNAGSTIIQVHMQHNMTVQCEYPNQIIDLLNSDVQTYGQLICPQNFSKFCASTLQCLNNCNSKGFCNKGTCYCQDGVIGGDCSQVQIKSHCLQGYFENPDQSCREDCPDGYFREMENRMCIICHSACSKCFGKSSDECYDCHKPFYLFEWSCMSTQSAGVGNCDASCNECSKQTDPNACLSCFDNFYLNSSSNCVACITNCKVCKNTTACTQCILNYKFDPFTSACVFNCDISCNKCSAGNNPLACTSCFNGRFLDTDNSCKQCDSSCQTCSGNLPTMCLSCKDGFYLAADNTCKGCDSSCITCSGSTLSNCLSCDDGKYLTSSNKCNSCSGSCVTCITSSSHCLKCNGNKAPDSTGNCYPCDSSCLTCTAPQDSQSCDSCVPGQFVNGNNECQKCANVCITCNGSSTICQQCIQDYHLDPTSKCVPDCDPSCLTCDKPHDSKACLTCTNVQFVNANKECKPCLAPCLTCEVVETKCKSCAFGFFLKPNSNVCFESCFKTCTDCLAPSDENQCISCIDGYFIQNNKCQPCVSPCKTCINSGTKCLSCISKVDYNFDKNVCIPICDPSCLTCSIPFNATACLTCIDGMYVSNGACLQCVSPCKTCVDTQDKCLSCVPTFEFQTNNTCKQICHPSCVSCTKAYTGEYCKACFEGSTLIALNADGSGLCRVCSSPCKTCEIGNEKACLSCISVDYQIDPATKKCVPICDSSCVTCYDPKNPGACLTCSDGKFLVNDQCRSCVPPCKNCAVSGYKCQNCIDKYSYDPINFQCLPICHPSCKSCYLPDDPTQCKSCSDDSFELNGGCVKCQDPCSKCQEKETKCLECVSKIYAYDKYKFLCINMCDKSCKMCSEQSDPNKCVSCPDRFYLTIKPEGACQSCQIPCLTCDGGPTQCTTCAPNYTQNALNPKVCTPNCHANCVTCSAPLLEQYCIVCNDGLFKNGDKCLPCDSPCQKCITSSTTCLSCVVNYTYDNTHNICNPICDPSCKTCTAPMSPQKCWTCIDGKFLNSKFECQSCQSPCKTCEYDSIRCLSCISAEYTYISLLNKCQLQCDVSCLDCSIATNPNACISCATGKFLTAQNTCLPCTLPCAQCETTATQCKTCTAGYSKDPILPQCNMICHSSCKTCSLSFSEDGCSSCSDGMYLSLPNGAVFGKCLQCTSPCKQCKGNSNFCLSCISDTQYTFISATGICKPICDRSCVTCSDPLNPKACTSCVNGYFINQQNQCQQCSYPCGTCKSASYYCDTCISTEFTYDPPTKRCLSDCHESCATCFVAYDAKQCRSCFDGFFLVARTCQACSSPCKNCEVSSTQCTSCIDNYSLTVPNTPNFPKKCLPNCHTSCSTCDKPIDQNSCLTCYAGYYYQASNKSCQKCQFPNCAICDKQSCIQCLTNFYIDSNNKDVGCQPICDNSCITCSSPINPNACLTCPDGKFNSFNSCQPCKFPCTKCNSTADQCLACAADYTWNNMICTPICHETCQTCSLPKNSKSCITCPAISFINNESECITCKAGQLVTKTGCVDCPINCEQCDVQRSCKKCVSGYSLNTVGECQIQSQVVTCHSTCRTCISQNYDACTSCFESRNFTPTSYSYSDVGMCECPDNTTDTNKPVCEDSPLQKNIKNTATGVYVASITVSILGAISASNPILIFGLIEFSQTVSFFRYVNQKSTVGFDDVMGSLYTTHFTKLFNFESLAEKEKQQKRQLVTDIQGDQKSVTYKTDDNNTKIFLNGKYPTFLANVLALLILSVVAWLVSLLVGMMEYKNYGSLTDKLQRIFCISLPLVIFVFSTQEYSLLCFYQYQFFGFNTSNQSASSIFSILVIVYIILFLIYLTYKLEYQKVLFEQQSTQNSQYLVNECYSNSQLQTQQLGQNNSQYQKSQINQTMNFQRKIVPYETVTNMQGRMTPPQQQQSLTVDQRRFYVLYKYIKQDKLLQRNFVQIMVIRKIICALITAFGYKSAIGQAVGLFILYIAFWVYIIFVNPFIQKRDRLMCGAIETVVVVMHILLLVLVGSDEDDINRKQIVSVIMIVIVIITLIVYLAISFVLLALSLYKYFSKHNSSTHISSFQQIQDAPSMLDQSIVLHNQSIIQKPQLKQSEIQPVPPAIIVHKKQSHLLNLYQSGNVQSQQQQSNQPQNQQYQQQSQFTQLQKQMGYDTYAPDSPEKGQSKRIYLEPISNRGGYENNSIQSGVQLYSKNQQSPSKLQSNQHVQFQATNNQSPTRVYSNIQQNKLQQNQQSSSPSKLYNGTTPSKIYKDYY